MGKEIAVIIVQGTKVSDTGCPKPGGSSACSVSLLDKGWPAKGVRHLPGSGPVAQGQHVISCVPWLFTQLRSPEKQPWAFPHSR